MVHGEGSMAEVLRSMFGVAAGQGARCGSACAISHGIGFRRRSNLGM